MFERFIGGLPGKGRVVDLGCGAGRELARLAEAGLDARGYDLSPTLAATARARSGASVAVEDMRRIRLRPGSLDGVLALDSLLHLGGEELGALLEAIAGWLKPGGLFLATMKVGRGIVVDAAGRRFLLVDPAGWRSALDAAGLEIHAAMPRSDQVAGPRPDSIATLARKPG